MSSNLYCLLLLLPSIFSSDLALHVEWPKYWSFSFSPSNEYSGLISFRIDWFDLCAVQGTLHSLLQHQSESINCLALSLLYGSALTTKQNYGFSISYVWLVSKTTGKTTVLTLRTFVSKVISLLFKIHCLGLSQLFFQGASVF